VATRVLIAGGGVAALEAALALRALAEDRVSVEMLAPEPQFWYRPLAVAEPFDLGEVRQFELPDLAAAAAGATFSPGALSGVDAGGRLAQTSAGSTVPYAVLLVACGVSPTPAVPGALTFRETEIDVRHQRSNAATTGGSGGRASARTSRVATPPCSRSCAGAPSALEAADPGKMQAATHRRPRRSPNGPAGAPRPQSAEPTRADSTKPRRRSRWLAVRLRALNGRARCV
jgi:hypothetical protein